MLYLTGVSNEVTRAAHRPDLGLLGTPAGATWRQKENYTHWAADNGCFAELSRPGAFKPARWLAWLEEAGPERCLWATLPDIVGDCVGTWQRSEPYVQQVREMGFPVAVVLQDGLENERLLVSEILHAADAVFVGGSTEWKLSKGAAQLCHEAAQRGLWVHVGRVNSYKRLRHCNEVVEADSCDGTYLNYGRKEDRVANTHKLFGWLDLINRKEAA